MPRSAGQSARDELPRDRRETKSGQVQSLTRALSIMRALAQSTDGMTLSDLAHTVSLPPSTTHRLLTTLQHERFARFDPVGSLWQVGVQAFIVGNAFARSRDVVSFARPYMRRLMEESGETVNLYLESEGEAVCISQTECRQLMRAIARPGGRVKMHHSGVGKAILAWLPDATVASILSRHGMSRATERTLDNPARLHAHLAMVRRRGYALDDEENAVGLRCVGAAVFDEHGQPIAGLSVSGPTARVADDRLAMLGALVAGIADEITAELGGRRPQS